METEAVKEVSIDTLGMKEFKEARSKGVLTVPTKAVDDGESDDNAVIEETDAEVSAHGEDGSEDSKPTENRPKVKGGFQKKIDRLIKHNSTLEQQLADERKARQELEAKGGKPGEKKAEPASTRPTREQFTTDDEFIDAVVEWKLKSKQEAEAKAEQEAERKAVFDSYNERLLEARATLDDYDEVMESAKDINIPQGVWISLVRMKNGPQVAYNLAKNEELRERLEGLSPEEQIGEVFIISRELASGSDKKEKPVKAEEAPTKIASKSAPPIKPVSGGNSKSSVPLDQMSMKEFKAARAAGRVS